MKWLKIIFIFLLFLIPVLANCQKKKESKDRLSDHFNRPPKTIKKERLSSPFSSEKTKPTERKLLPTFYANAVKKAAEHNQLPSFFGKKIQKEKERTEQPDFFTKPLFKRERTQNPDHFTKKRANKEHTEKDVSIKVKEKRVYRKNFFGERRFYFAKDPNEKKGKKHRVKTKDPFGKRKKDEQQNAPRGEKDLFGNGVLPKMKDMR